MAYFNGVSYLTNKLPKRSCVPAAVYNIMKWAGYPISRARFKGLCKRIPPCDYGRIQREIRKIKGIVLSRPVIIKPVCLKDIDQHLIAGRILLIITDWADGTGHASLCVGKKGNQYVLVNAKSYGTLDRINRAKFKGFVRDQKFFGYRAKRLWYTVIKRAK